MTERIAVAILAAGQGTRFRSRRAKVLHAAGGRTLIEHVIRTAARLAPQRTFVIVGHQSEAVIASLQDTPVKNLEFIRQQEQRGTGHALLSGHRRLEKAAPLLVVLSGDTPLLTPETVRRLIAAHRRSRAAATVLTAEMQDPHGYGRIVRADGRTEGNLLGIVEHKSASAEQLEIREVNTGIYCFQAKLLFPALRRIQPDPITGELYLTDVVRILAAQGARVAACKAPDPAEVMGVNNRAELARVDAILRARKTRELMLAGVTILAPETVRIDPDVTVGSDTDIEPGVILSGRTRIGANCRLGAYSVITDSELASGATVLPYSVITESRVASGARIGPFSHLRPGSDIGPGAHIGAFVEVKKSRVGRDVRAHHLTYLGDATLGARVNIGAGTITCNFDGSRKHETVIDADAFIGSGSELVAPVRVGRGAYVAAGSVITDEVPAHALAIARGRQVTKPDWARRRTKGKVPRR